MRFGKIAAWTGAGLLVAGGVVWSWRFRVPNGSGPKISHATAAAVGDAKLVKPSASPSPGPSPAPVEKISKPRPELTAAQLAQREARQAERKKEKALAAEANRLAKTRADAVRRLTPLFQQLALSPEQQEKLIGLVVNQHEAGIDLAVANAKQGVDLTLDREAYWAANGQLNLEFQAEVKALLGDEGYQAFLANDLVVRQAAVVEHLQTRLTPGGEPLTNEQTQQLLALLQAQNSFRVDDNILASASRFLSPTQMEQLKLEHTRQTQGVLKPAVQKAISKNFDPAAGLSGK